MPRWQEILKDYLPGMEGSDTEQLYPETLSGPSSGVANRPPILAEGTDPDQAGIVAERRAIPDQTQPSLSPSMTGGAPQSGGVVPERQTTGVPGPSNMEAIQPPAEKPKSIREYLDLMRSQGQTPFFTNIQGRPGPQGQQAFEMPQERGMDVRYNPATPGGVDVQGTMQAKNVLGPNKKAAEEGPYNPSQDPFEAATAFALRDAPQMWQMMVGDGRPMDTATPQEYKKFSEIVGSMRDQYLGSMSKRREEFVKLTAAGFPADAVSEALMNGTTANLKRLVKVTGPPSQKEAMELYQSVYKAESEKGTTPEAARSASMNAVTNFLSSWNIILGQGQSGGGGKASATGQEAGMETLPPQERAIVQKALKRGTELEAKGIPREKIIATLDNEIPGLAAIRKKLANSGK